MKYYIPCILGLFCYVSVTSQSRIIYDLDAYLRVDGVYRTTFIIPNADLGYSNIINDPSKERDIQFVGGLLYNDNRIINNPRNQKVIEKSIDFDFTNGQANAIAFKYDYENTNRYYGEDKKYFKSRFYVSTDSRYQENQGVNKTYLQTAALQYGLGFGFGRIEVVNDAWLGARILEELRMKNLLLVMPSSDEMKTFFDVVGDLSFERVMDNRLRSIYQIETLIKYIEEQGWIEKGSIPAFATIYDAFRFEDFLFRQSGERLEFTLTPRVDSWLNYRFNEDDVNFYSFQPGFSGRTEYEVNRNGDLEYYTSMVLGGTFNYTEQINNNDFDDENFLNGSVYFRYSYYYLPSRRTNLIITGNVSAGFAHSSSYNAVLNMFSRLEYNYYFSPATQLVMQAALTYNDPQFQIGDYQPSIKANFSMNVVHAIR
ncbi:MAG: hypothetical protein AAGA77_21120 [Bacteroidota bacterium]